MPSHLVDILHIFGNWLVDKDPEPFLVPVSLGVPETGLPETRGKKRVFRKSFL